MKEKKIKYKAFSFRLHEGTYDILKEIKEKKGISWNRLIYEIVNFYKNNYKEDDHRSKNRKELFI